MGVRENIDAATEYLHDETVGGVALLVATAIALVWANLGGSYLSFWHTELTLGVGSLSITEDLQHWVNDGLMALFFFVVALEVKREFVTGDLRDRRTATVPVLAALGGIGFTVSLFIAQLAYTDPLTIGTAKFGIFAGSIVSALLGMAILLKRGKSAVTHP